MTWLSVPALALALDLLLGDPPSLPHPVRGIGRLADKLEDPARRLGDFCGRPVLAGTLALGILCLISGGLAALLCALPGFLGTAMALYLAFAGLALGSLIKTGQSCLPLIEKAQINSAALPEARRAVQMLVSRDASAMDAPELYRSLAESLSENLNDAFVAPFFWLCLTGPVGLWLYKTVSTMDSMWGYKNERFLHLGRAAARLDDLLAFIPARLCVVLMLVTAWAMNLPGLFAAWSKEKKQSGREEEDSAGFEPPLEARSEEKLKARFKEAPAAAILILARLRRPGDLPLYSRIFAQALDISNKIAGAGGRCPLLGRSGGARPLQKKAIIKSSARADFFSVPGWPGWSTVAKQAKNMESPNAGWPMAAAAWLFEGRSGGPTPYNGEIIDKAPLGPDSGLWTAENCARLLAHARATGIAGLILSVILYS